MESPMLAIELGGGPGAAATGAGRASVPARAAASPTARTVLRRARVMGGPPNRRGLPRGNSGGGTITVDDLAHNTQPACRGDNTSNRGIYVRHGGLPLDHRGHPHRGGHRGVLPAASAVGHHPGASRPPRRPRPAQRLLVRQWHPGQVAGTPMLIVDATNVVGSVPDGWWRDRAAAVARLRDALAGIADQGLAPAGLAPPVYVVLVVEGVARGTESLPEVRVVAAPRSADDTIVDLVRAERAGRDCVVVTADRELRARVTALGARVVGSRAVPRTPPG